MRANIHALGFESCIVEVAFAEDQDRGSFSYDSKYPPSYKPKEGTTLNIAIWGGPTFNAQVTETLDDAGGGTTVRFKRLPS